MVTDGSTGVEDVDADVGADADVGVGVGVGVDEGLVDALLAASRALVAVAARSLDDLEDDLTLPQFRALVVLLRSGPLATTRLAERVGVHQSTGTRIAQQLRRRGLVSQGAGQDRRVTVVSLTDHGRGLVQAVLDRRRADIRDVVARMQDGGADLVRALEQFSAAAESESEDDPHLEL